MNSEELEQSLRTEFESYLKNVLADVRQEVSEFQKQFEAEFEKHKAQIDEVFQNFSARLAAEKELDASFTESVVEHLRLSRDEGARITATAIAEAEELEKQNALETAEAVAPTVSYSELRDAINDISTKTTQSAILKTLVHHASQFTPRGAFFIIKNEHLVGWRVFGKEGETADEHTVREVFFPVASSTILGESVRSLAAVESGYGTYTDDSIYLNKLGFSQPANMYAVPLVVRGRSVAALYADNGTENGAVNVEALETLVRVASLTVEVLASARAPQSPAEAEEATAGDNHFEEPAPAAFSRPAEPVAERVEEPAPAAEPAYRFAETPAAPVEEAPVETRSAYDDSFAYRSPVEDNFAYQPIEQPSEAFEEPSYQKVEGNSFSFTSSRPGAEVESAPAAYPTETAVEEEAPAFRAEPSWSANVETSDYYAKQPEVEYETPTYEIPEPAPVESNYASNAGGSEYQFESTSAYEAPAADFQPAAPAYEAPSYETPAYETPAYETESYAPANGGGAYTPAPAEPAPVVEKPVETAVKTPSKGRFSERNVDLPIEVSEDERRLHNDARRFARLLVSEIKLYNEQKVKEGRESNDLYERLREAIDRSREMYDKRVQPPVAAKFDYFHYELVSNLAEGDEGRLGASYPGAAV